MDMLGKIRRLRFRDGLSISEIVRRTGFSRNTVKSWLKGNRSPSGVLPIIDQSVNARAFVQRQRGRNDERRACGVTTRSEATGAVAS